MKGATGGLNEGLHPAAHLPVALSRQCCGCLFGALGVLLPCALHAQQPPTFDPPKDAPMWAADRCIDPPAIDGVLNEPAWALAASISAFVQKDPVQGAPPSQRTEARFLWDDAHLYVGVICYDSAGGQRPRIQDLRRDFDPFQNDMFSLAFDGMGDHRNAQVFQTTPFGNQRDMQVMNGESFNEDWNSLWAVATARTDSYWTAEFAIPWRSLRYRKGATDIRLSMTRGIRKNNEMVSCPPIPRAYSYLRMEYAARLVGIVPPAPSLSMQLQPYVLADGPLNTAAPWRWDVGGEVKWAPTPNTVVDATVNTDFAQTDVDRQVNNLSRFSIFFPEKRQFFLDNASVFEASGSSEIIPFYSRRIGLDANGVTRPIDAGARVVSQSDRRSLGALLVRERSTERQEATHTGVLRYTHNVTDKTRFGTLLTMLDERDIAEGPGRMNVSASADAFLRPTRDLTINTMGSFSHDNVVGDGFAGHCWVGNYSNIGYYGWLQQYVDARYTPGTGFVQGNNYVLTSPAFDLDLRPKWLPKKVRNLAPYAYGYLYHDADDLEFQQASIDASLTSIRLQNGTFIGIGREQEWQRITEVFTPLGITILPGEYSFGRTWLYFSTDGSRKLSGTFVAKQGKYYDGDHRIVDVSAAYAPDPHVRLSGGWSLNAFADAGLTDTTFNAQLLNVGMRVAPFARLQITGSYQYNTASASEVVNARVAWDYHPLSFIYLVFGQGGFLAGEDRREQRMIGKVTWVKQL